MELRAVPREPAGMDMRPVLQVLWNRRRIVLAAAIAAAVVTLGVTFLMPRWYRATAVILPPEQSDLLSNMARAQRALTRFPVFGILEDYFTPADIYKAVLMSRSVGEEVVRGFDLQAVYRKPSMEKTLKELRTHARVRLNPDGTIQVAVEDKSPKRAADMANAYITALDRYNVEKRNTQARRTREFLERRVWETDSLLRLSEAMLREYQERHHTIVPSSTVSSSDVQAAADLMARKLMLEIRLGMLRSYLREDNEQVVQTRMELDQMRQRISTLPRLQGDVARLVRDQKIQEQLFLLLTAELEQSRIRETMDTPTVEILDAAVPPERHVRPLRAIYSLAAGMLGFLGACAWVVAAERPAHLRRP